ncbi:hypothetical protein [Synergistes jonesii]|uniref:hypothetical protein n=1 Tax=Synergistes jonesii TaxID=2754 RepID=UPI00242F499C|nr:hypothetical protein [Synergistes jonesii]
MKSKKIFRSVAATILACAMIFQSAPAVFAAEGEPEGVALPQKYTELIMKEHDKYIEAFLNAEMGNRYFLKQIYDAKYGGKKVLTKEELKAMLFELRILNKELSASAKRYIRNIDMAKLAMAGMDEEERTLLAKALSYIFATPAYAFDFSVLDKIKSGLQSVADAADTIADAAVSAADAFVEKAGEVMDSVVEKAGAAMDAVGEKVSAMADKVDKEVEQFKNRYFTMATVYRGGEILAAGTVFLATAAFAAVGTVSAVGTLAGAVALGAPAVSTLAVLGMLGAIGLGVTLGITQTAEASLAFADVVVDEDNSSTEFRKDLKKINLYGSALSITSGVVTGISGAAETTVNIVDATKDYWIPKILGGTSEDPKAPGRAGVDKVKKAKASAGNSKVGDGGGG